MHKSLRVITNILFLFTVIIVACIIATMALVKKIDKDNTQYNNGLEGTVIKQSVPILALSSGVVKKIYVRPGDTVRKNDLLVELDNPVLAGKIQALQNYPNNVSAQTEAKVAQEEVKGWKLYAPTDGVVTDIFVNEGSPVQELMKIINLYSNDNILLLANLSNDQYASVQQLHQTSAYSQRLNQNFAIDPDILQPDEKVNNFNEKKIGLYFRFKDEQEAQSLLNNEDLDLHINEQSTQITKPIDYVVRFWNSLFNKQIKK
ncbi:MAG TPA: biotin/lipoyl-binding protein [Methylomirabilota bacterium]|nr:biotin/lipoyl-binding protein [Methylomirabilota bacterium]